jgi:asparagine synthase (glutamine-hydrolysing)
MCGIFGSITAFGAAPDLKDSEVDRILDALDHRGPDGRGTWGRENFILGHTRLAVRDLGSRAANQPLVTPDGRFALVYNGELYGDRELRQRLEPAVLRATGGQGFATTCDAETLLWALALEGPATLDRLRGMYALAFVDLKQRTMVLARDPLGVKPLVWARTETGGLAFASEPRALLQHPGVALAPDPAMIGAYLVTSRRSFAGRTFFEGIQFVDPGSVLEIQLASGDPAPKELASGVRFSRPVDEKAAPAAECADIVDDSIRAQLVSDVPVCAFLSGGLDSAILTHTAADERARHGASPLASWCASAIEDGVELGPDPPIARGFADVLGSVHTDVHTNEATYLREWHEHIAHLWQPLSTPNEIAISETARAIRQTGAIVALSGEGADELFAGYDGALAAFCAHASMDDPPIDAARFHLEIGSWVSPAALGQVMRGPDTDEISDYLVKTNWAAFECAKEEAGVHGTALDAHLRLQCSMNLTPLLERLDGALMRHGVEGRTPFADEAVLAFANRQPFAAKFEAHAGGAHASKMILRDAFRSQLPQPIVDRPKASFPMPFERWSAHVAVEAAASPFVREWVQPAALAAVQSDPIKHWKLSWLIGNLGLFGEAAFGASRVSQRAAS